MSAPFKTGDAVVTKNYAHLTHRSQRGTIKAVYGYGERASYLVEFVWNGFDEPRATEYEIFLDFELEFASEK